MKNKPKEVLAILFSFALFLPACGEKEKTKPADIQSEESKTAKNVPKSPQVLISTSMGNITLELNSAKAPISVENFLKYLDSGHYKQTAFHRVIKNFMIQGGGFVKSEGGYEEKETNKPIKNEADNGLKNTRGTVAMARTNAPHSATAQFFINVVDNPFLDHQGGNRPGGYAVFGKVIEGMDVVDKIRAVETANSALKMRTPRGEMITAPAQDVPIEPVIIESISRVKK